MRGLLDSEPLPKNVNSPLASYVKRNLWVTASPDWFRSHLKYTAARVPNAYRWGFKVVTDADLVVAWLATAALQGANIIDADFRSEAAPVSLTKMTLVDIADPPDLLIVRTGIKAARNSATSEVLMEALTHRSHAQKPTWIWDQPDNRLCEGHLAYSHVVHEFINTKDWGRLRDADNLPLNAAPGAVSSPATRKKAPAAIPAKVGLSVRDMMFGNTNGGDK